MLEKDGSGGAKQYEIEENPPSGTSCGGQGDKGKRGMEVWGLLLLLL